jgi:hypothetical protein
MRFRRHAQPNRPERLPDMTGGCHTAHYHLRDEFVRVAGRHYRSWSVSVLPGAPAFARALAFVDFVRRAVIGMPAP